MTISARPTHSNMSRRANSPGWATFDFKQRQKQGLEIEADTDPYPPMLSTSTSLLPPHENFVKNIDPSVRSFSSLLQPSVNSQSLKNDNKETEVPLELGNSSEEKSNEFIEAFKKLHSWADRSLIEDVMAAVDNNVDKASTLLQAMVSYDSVKENKESKMVELKSNPEDIFPENGTFPADKGVSLVETKDSLNCKTEGRFELIDSYGERIPDTTAPMKLIFSHLKSMPVEPEWEEDDIYLIHRKEALRMMRSASQHSRAASDAYTRGDHFSAQQFSLKAREEWMAAERLNSKAAKEILSMRNCESELWKLDLHGLHAAEAVQALQEHLQKIETQVPLDRSVCPDKVNIEAGIVNSASLESFSGSDIEKLAKQQQSSRQRLTLLEVITGKGNHSRGQAALPAAVRNFLNENRYRYDEARPGIITVWPKFRHRMACLDYIASNLKRHGSN